jgi:hypothetical protein
MSILCPSRGSGSLTVAAGARVARGDDNAVAEDAHLLELRVHSLLVVLRGLVLALIAVTEGRERTLRDLLLKDARDVLST